jgi:hypothetical protein
MTESRAISILPSAAIALQTLDRLEMEILKAPTFEKLDAATRTAQGLQLTFKPVKDVADRSGEIWIRAERRLAEELAKLPKATGGQPYQRKSTGSNLVPVDASPTRAELGVDKKRSAKAAKLAAIPEKKLDDTIERLKAENKPVNPNTVLKAATAHGESRKPMATRKSRIAVSGHCQHPAWLRRLNRHHS